MWTAVVSVRLARATKSSATVVEPLWWKQQMCFTHHLRLLEEWSKDHARNQPITAQFLRFEGSQAFKTEES
jgi:hypothetical protein